MNGIFQLLSATTLLAGSTYFGYASKPTEMGLAILAGALGLAFSNLDKFSEFSGAGFSAKMKDQIQAVIDKETEELPSAHPESASVETPESIMLKVLANPKHTWRTLSGVSAEAGCSESEASATLVSLTEKKLVRCGNKIQRVR